MTALSLIMAAIGVAGAILRPARLPVWAIPLAAVAVDLIAGAASWHDTDHALRTLADPIGFLLAAVPLAVLLDHLGFFTAAARRLTGQGHAAGGLWVLAAAVTTVLNLDAGIVLLTPLYVRIARRHGTSALALAAQPLILAWLASSALPVSNLTNLIVTSKTGASTWQFLEHLGLPSLVAVVVGWLCYRRLTLPTGTGTGDEAAELADAEAERDEDGDVDDRRALLVGSAVVVAVLVGFVAGPSAGIQEWEVALAADVVLVGFLRDLPWRSLPVSTALVAASLGVLASTVALHVRIDRLLGGPDLAGLARTAGVSALLANLVNNLPALLVLAPGTHAGPGTWAVLIGVNMGPVLLATGTLASLLWLATLRRLGVRVSSWDVTRLGLKVGLPAATGGLLTLLALHAAGVPG
jgi:arsenical pump membrane protein